MRVPEASVEAAPTRPVVRRRRRTLRRATILGGLAGAAVGLAAHAPGQDALRSSLSLDRALVRPANTNAPVDWTPPPLHLGPLQLELGVYSSGEFRDNLFLAPQAPQSDFLLRGGVRTALTWRATEQSELRMSASLGYVRYLDHPQYDSLEVAPESALSWSMFLPDGTITLFDQLSYSHSVATEAALASLAPLGRLDENAGTRGTWLPGRWFVEGTYSHDEYMAATPGFAYLDRSSDYLVVRVAYRVAELTQAGFEASGGLTSFREHIQADYRNFSAGPYAEWQVNDYLHASMHGGPAYYFFDATPGAAAYQLSSYYASARLDHQLTAFISHSLSLERSVQPGFYSGSDYLEQLSARYSLSWALTARVSLGVDAVYEQGDQKLPLSFGPFIVLVNEDYDHYGAGPNLTFQLTDRLSANLAYHYWQRESSLPLRGYALNTVRVTLDYRL